MSMLADSSALGMCRVVVQDMPGKCGSAKHSACSEGATGEAESCVARHAQFVVRDVPGKPGEREVAGVDWIFTAWGGDNGGLYKPW